MFNKSAYEIVWIITVYSGYISIMVIPRALSWLDLSFVGQVLSLTKCLGPSTRRTWWPQRVLFQHRVPLSKPSHRVTLREVYSTGANDMGSPMRIYKAHIFYKLNTTKLKGHHSSWTAGSLWITAPLQRPQDPHLPPCIFGSFQLAGFPQGLVVALLVRLDRTHLCRQKIIILGSPQDTEIWM